MEGTSTYAISASWSIALKEGRLANADGTLDSAHGSAPALGGKAGTPNPEEILLSAVAACFVQTWAIFIEKLRLEIPEPFLDSVATMEKDPAGGFKVTSITLTPHVPKALLDARKADVDKTLSLAEKYCIVSKAVKASLALTVEAKAV